MLVLSRQRDETIMIGDDVEITVVDIRGDKVRLGITAPPHIPVHRKEVYEAIKRENRAASQVKPEDLDELSTSDPASGARTGPPGPPPGAQPVIKARPERTRLRSDNGKDTAAHTPGRKNGKSVVSNSGCEGTQSTGA